MKDTEKILGLIDKLAHPPFLLHSIDRTFTIYTFGCGIDTQTSTLTITHTHTNRQMNKYIHINAYTETHIYGTLQYQTTFFVKIFLF